MNPPIQRVAITGAAGNRGSRLARAMIDGTRWLSQHLLLGIWHEQAGIHRISVADLLPELRYPSFREGIKCCK